VEGIRDSLVLAGRAPVNGGRRRGVHRACNLLSVHVIDDTGLYPLSPSPAALQAEVLPACIWLLLAWYTACRTRTDQDAEPRSQALQSAQGWWGLGCSDIAAVARVPCNTRTLGAYGGVRSPVVVCRDTRLHSCTLLYQS